MAVATGVEAGKVGSATGVGEAEGRGEVGGAGVAVTAGRGIIGGVDEAACAPFNPTPQPLNRINRINRPINGVVFMISVLLGQKLCFTGPS
jgi:hypothetical protein